MVFFCQKQKNNTFYLTYFPDNSVTLPVGMLVACIPISVISKMLMINFLYTHYFQSSHESSSLVLFSSSCSLISQWHWMDWSWPLCVIPLWTDDPLNLLVSNWQTEGKFHFIFAKIKELHNNRTEFCLVRGCLGVIPSAETRNVLSIFFFVECGPFSSYFNSIPNPPNHNKAD